MKLTLTLEKNENTNWSVSSEFKPGEDIEEFAKSLGTHMRKMVEKSLCCSQCGQPLKEKP